MRAAVFGGLVFFTGGIMHAMAWLCYALIGDFPEQLSIVGIVGMVIGLVIGVLGLFIKGKKCKD